MTLALRKSCKFLASKAFIIILLIPMFIMNPKGIVLKANIFHSISLKTPVKEINH